jgi:uncharacterized protein with PIN domain
LMRNKGSALTILDGGVLIALALGEPSAAELSDDISNRHGLYACTEIALCELSYILCRNSTWKQAWSKTQSLIQSSAVAIISSQSLWVEAAQIKCSAAIALPDCFSIAAARVANGKVIFARREKEIIEAIRKKGLSDPIEFLE